MGSSGRQFLSIAISFKNNFGQKVTFQKETVSFKRTQYKYVAYVRGLTFGAKRLE